MKKNRRKILSMILAIAMIVTAYHVPSRAAGNDKISDKILDQLGTGVEKDGSYLEVPKLGDREEEEVGELKPINLSEVLRVSIVLDKPGTIEAGYPMKNIANNSSAMSYRNNLKTQQAVLINKIQQVTGKKLDVKWNITLGANIISANMTRGDMIKIASVSGIKKLVIENLYAAPITEPNTSNTPGMIGADTVAWANGFYGAGSKIMIIDTGTNQDHLSFSGEALEYALTKDGKSLNDYDLLTQADVAAVASQLNAGKGLDAAQSYKSLKIPFAYNYIDRNYVTDHSADEQGEHGSHVSGIAAANRFVKFNGAFEDSLETVLACGVAPDAQILTAKVFGKGGGAYDSDYFVAIEDAIILGCDAVNLSLGAAVAGFAFSEDYQENMDALTEKGLVMVTSAGNSYAFNNAYAGRYINTAYPYNYIEDINMSTGGSPGSFINTLTVASAENVGRTDLPLIFNGDQVVFYWESTANTQKNPPILYGNPEIWKIAGNYDYVLIDGLGKAEEYAAVNEAVSLEGKVVMVFRGDITFVEKVNNAVPYKPAAVVVVNNQAGEILMSLSDDTGASAFKGDFPCVAISLENGLRVANASTQGTAGDYDYFTGKVEVKDTYVSALVTDPSAPAMSDFSSWGGGGSLLLKPEITAPGGNIWSVNGMTNGGYENMSGTSMAAPQVTGMMALFGEYYRYHLKAAVDAAFGANAFSERQLAHSLLMSTSVPLIEQASGTYYPILRQGSGLADIGNVLAAQSFIMMKDDATVAAGDGKVKAELGQSTDGKYSYTFTIYNPSGNDLIYDLRTDLFTQDVFGYQGFVYMDEWAVDMDGKVTYSFPKSTGLHDVDKDGDTDTDDVQAILDYLSGERDGADLDLSTPVADLDEDSKVTSYDAVLLLSWLYSMNDETEDADTILVPAGTSKDVVVTIDVSSWDDSYYPSGMWVEGYTFVSCQSISNDGAKLDVEHSIPLLGFYGCFTDASMYDANSYTEVLYGNKKMTYGDDPETNYMLIQYEGAKKPTIFTGNPYAVEDVFPADRLAISSKTLISSFHYDLIRGAGTTGMMVRKADDDRNVTDEILTKTIDGAQYPIFFHINQIQWIYSAGRVDQSVGAAPADLGLKEGDVFNISRYAIPEYYAMKLNGSKASTLTESELEQLLKSSDADTVLGEGAFLGFTLKVDDTRPTIEPLEADPESDEVTVSFHDNEYVAYVAIMDPSGQTVYDAYVPEQSEAGETLTLTIKKSDYALNNAVTVFVADYAGNESAAVVRTGEGEITAEQPYTIYVPTDTIEEGKQYVATVTNEEGYTIAMDCYGDGFYLGRDMTYIDNGAFEEYEGLFIASEDINLEMLWGIDSSASNYIPGTFFMFNETEDGTIAYLQNYGQRPATVSSDGKIYYGLFWTYEDQELYSPYYETFVVLNDSYTFVMSEEPAKIYLWEPMEITVLQPYDPYAVSEITVDPENYTLIPSIGLNSVQLTATVNPLTAEDRSVTWSSSNEEVATVDQNGLVTAVSLGSATITVTANDGSGVSAKAVINVVEEHPMPEGTVVYGQIEKEDKTVEFVEIDLHDMTMKTVARTPDVMKGYPFIGGGRSGNVIWGSDEDDDVSLFDVSNNYSWTELGELKHANAFRDAANLPELVFTSDGTDYPLVLTAVSNGNLLQLMTETGGYVYFELNEEVEADIVAIAFVDAGTDKDEEGDEYLYYDYYALDSTGAVWAFELYQYVGHQDDVGLETLRLGQLTGFACGSDPAAYSLVFAYDQTRTYSLFLADNTSKSLWYIDLQASANGVIPAVYIGAPKGVINLSTLYNNTFDTVQTVTSAGTDELADVHESMRSLIGGQNAVLKTDKLLPAVPEAAEDPAVPENEAPAEEVPAEDVTEAPAEEEPAEATTEAPAEAEPEAPAEEVTEAPAEEEPAEATTEAPAEEEPEAPAEDVTEAPAEEEPAEATTEAPAEEEPEAPAEDVTEAPAEEEPAGEPANPVVGGLNAAPITEANSGRPEDAVALRSSNETESESSKNGNSLLLSLTNDVDATNGLITLSYEKDQLKFLGVTNPEAPGAELDDMFFSAHEDKEAGKVTFVYATLNVIEAGDEVAELEFVKPCEDMTLVLAATERNRDLDLDEEAKLELEGTGHDWQLDSVTWEGSDEEGYTKGTFTFICGNNSDHVDIVTDEKLDVETDGEGNVTYTAEVIGPDGKTYTETKKVMATPATGDASNLPLFVTMGSTATAALLGVMRIRRKKEDEEE